MNFEELEDDFEKKEEEEFYSAYWFGYHKTQKAPYLKEIIKKLEKEDLYDELSILFVYGN